MDFCKYNSEYVSKNPIYVANQFQSNLCICVCVCLLVAVILTHTFLNTVLLNTVNTEWD